ncbi:MAG: TadE/TadG family type IV pilus assembly protein [Chloroflexota bacterium]
MKIVEKLSSEKGNQLVESAILLPLFLFILLGVADLGMGFSTYIALTNSAREGARWMTIHPDDRSGSISRIHNEIQNIGLNPTDVQISFSPNQTSYESGDIVTIAVRHDYTLLFGAFTYLPPLQLDSRATMRVLYDF